MLTQPTFSQITEGMDVYDRDGAKIGTVKAFRPGEGTIRTTGTDIVTMANAISECLGGQKELPTVLYSRLYDEGFVCINRGFLRADAVAFTNEVEDVQGDVIVLNVRAEDLLKV